MNEKKKKKIIASLILINQWLNIEQIIYTFSSMVALVFSKPDLAEAAMLAAVSFAEAVTFFPVCIFQSSFFSSLV